MFKKLRAAIRKATHRANERDAEVQADRARAHELTGGVQELHAQFDALHERHVATLAAIATEEGRKRPDAGALERLHAKAAKEARELRHIVVRIHHKQGRRAAFRTAARRAAKRMRWWMARQTVLRKKLAAAKKRYEETHGTPVFETWMLNGCPDIDNPRLKQVIAFVVVVCDQYITATTNGTHTSTSFHYSERAADWGARTVASMQAAAVKVREHFGRDFFLEFFSPCPWWLKYGVEYPGYFPGHGDHGHTAVEK